MLNWCQASEYFHMCNYRYNIHDRPTTKIGEPDSRCTCSGQEKSGMEEMFIEQGQLLDLVEDESDNGMYAEDMEVQAVDV